MTKVLQLAPFYTKGEFNALEIKGVGNADVA
jgi:hypothetical protein